MFKSDFPADEIGVEMVSGLGQRMGQICFPRRMEAGLIKTYLESGAVRSFYLYIDGKEITDGKNHNPFYIGPHPEGVEVPQLLGDD